MESKFFLSALLLLVNTFFISSAKVQYKVRCLEDVMQVDIVKTDSIINIYLDQLKNYPDEECQPKVDENHARLLLSLTDIHRCGVTRVFNRITGTKVFYHRVVVEHDGQPPEKEYVFVKCSINSVDSRHNVSKRNVLPAGFSEPEDLEVTTTLTGKAPEPMLSVGVRQGNEPVSGELNVNPGTPLTMEIYLDKASAPVYGVLTSYMQVTDTKQQEETIIFNGCSVDPYLFENFNTVNGDFLSAKFRAFKFPDSTYVQFRGTVNVCLDKCRGVDCSNGQTGYGRRRRDVPLMPADPNKLFEVSLTTFIKINFLDSKTEELKSGEVTNSSESVFILKDHLHPIQVDEEDQLTLRTVSSNNGVESDSMRRWKHESIDDVREDLEELKYAVVYEAENGSSSAILTVSLAILFLLLRIFH